MLRRLLIIPALLVCGLGFSQQRLIQATKTELAPKIDGNLDDPAWKGLPVADDFIQNFPTYGLKASVKTEVKIAYNNIAIFVSAYIHDDPKLVRKQITARDGEQQADVDYFAVFFDTYNDNQNGFEFLVTSMNVQTDARLGPNLGGDPGFGQFGDKSWDAVWDSKVSMKEDGWVVEMKIPYISLRFAKKDVQDWGLQFLSFSRRTNERCFWNPVDPNVNGFVNQFGDLSNLQNIEPPLRLSFSPYISTGVRSTPVAKIYSNEWLHNGGMDVKYGINESFTLDATLIPDFGQVVSDPQINNLSPFEVKFQENRPFFTEGTELFNKAGLFYSRRVGAVPPGYYDVLDMAVADTNLQIVKNPALTQLYNAIKLSGRTKNKLGIGVFNAITAPMHAIVRNKTTKVETKIPTAPLSNYNLIVLDQALKGRSYLTFTNASTIRNGDSRDANVSAFDFALYDKRNAHVLQGTARYSKIWQSSSYDGYNMILHYGKIIDHWQWSLHTNVESENYDPNDLGYLIAPNEVSYRGNLSYNIFAPTKNCLTYRYTFDARLNYLQTPYVYSRTDLSANGFWWFKNFWDVSVTLYTNPGWTKDFFELRTPGRYLAYPANYVTSFSGSSDSRKRFFINYGGQYATTPEFKNHLYGLTFGMRYRFSDRFILDLQTNKGSETNQMGYAFERETNDDPIVAFRDNTTFTSVLNGIYHFTPRMNISLRARHYWNKVEYKEFFDVDIKGKRIPRSFIPNKNENVNIFNFDAFLNWDFRLGSRLILGYKNWLGNDEVVNGNLHRGYFKNLSQSFSLRHGNELSVKFIYYLDYNQLTKK